VVQARSDRTHIAKFSKYVSNRHKIYWKYKFKQIEEVFILICIQDIKKWLIFILETYKSDMKNKKLI